MVAPNATILLVEDDPNDLLFMKIALEDAGVKNPLVVAKDGKEALSYLGRTGPFSSHKKHPLPALVLLDLKLPHVMGLDVLKWARGKAELRSTIFVVLTSSSHPRDIESAYQLGANAYLVKPSSFDQLRVLARSIKDFWLVHNQIGGCAAD
jgi:CheY-like chemotaxis protein